MSLVGSVIGLVMVGLIQRIYPHAAGPNRRSLVDFDWKLPARAAHLPGGGRFALCADSPTRPDARCCNHDEPDRP